MIYYILLVYTEKYYKNSIKQLEKLSKGIGNGEFKIIIVNNNSKINFKDAIPGDNSAFEFSGWDCAIDFLNKNKKENRPDYFIFANDTFCHHRKWGGYQRFKFTYIFNRFIKKKMNGICGDKNDFGKEIKLLGSEIDGWISSYLFILNSSFIIDNKLKFNVSKDIINEFVIGISDKDGIDFSDKIDKELASHLNSWLFPNKNINGWYNAKNANKDQKMKKLESILNEKILSVNVHKLGGKILGFNDFNFFLLFRILRGKFSK